MEPSRYDEKPLDNLNNRDARLRELSKELVASHEASLARQRVELAKTTCEGARKDIEKYITQLEQNIARFKKHAKVANDKLPAEEQEKNLYPEV